MNPALRPVPPFRMNLTVWALRRRAENLVDRWDGRRYLRVFRAGGVARAVAVSQAGTAEAPTLKVEVYGPAPFAADLAALARTVSRVLGLEADLATFYRLAARFRGLKPPRFPTVFEAALNAVVGQQVTLDFGIRLMNRLAAEFGPRLELDGEVLYGFPDPQDLAGQTPQSLRALGLSRQKAEAVLGLARAGTQGFDLEGLAGMEPDEAAACLRRFRAVGRWTAEYVLLRGLGRLEVFPDDDVGARNNLRRWLGLADPLDYDGTREVVARWHPYAGLVYFHLLLRWLAERGLLDSRGIIPGEGKMIRLKRVYEPPEPADGRRFLVERLWPRGFKRDELKLDGWVKEAAPSDGLRRWFGHDPARWEEFKARYFAELDSRPEGLKPLLEAARAGEITLLFSARDLEHNNAVALKEYLEARLTGG